MYRPLGAGIETWWRPRGKPRVVDEHAAAELEGRVRGRPEAREAGRPLLSPLFEVNLEA